MAFVSAENVTTQAAGFGSLTSFRQLGLMLGLAMSVALGVTVAMWSQAPNYSMLYGNLAMSDLSQVTGALDRADIGYRLEQGGSAILVTADRLHDARMMLAQQGLPEGGEIGYELLEKEQAFGSSSFLQKARYQRALEGELAQSISKLDAVRSARVHLAIPKQSAFARKNSAAAVSVVLHLQPGRVMDETQVAGIINMVASSVPGLDAEHVTLIDQKGHLLSKAGAHDDMLLSSTQFDYTRRIEERYAQRVVDIISPITGLDGVRAQVVADIDFTAQEQTRESYVPEQKVLRSEQVFKESSDQPGASGIPGALSNQPPPAGTVSDQLGMLNDTAANTPVRSTSRATRNFELDRTISHTRQSPVSLRRLSVAVVVDYRTNKTRKGKVEKTPLETAELERITALVKEAVGLDEARGDTINVVNTQFQIPEEVEPMPEPPVWQQPWVFSLAKQVLGGLAVLFIAFGVLRPTLRNLSTQGKDALERAPQLANQQAGQLTLGADQQNPGIGRSADRQQLMNVASGLVKEDPKRVAQVLNGWVGNDE